MARKQRKDHRFSGMMGALKGVPTGQNVSQYYNIYKC